MRPAQTRILVSSSFLWALSVSVAPPLHAQPTGLDEALEQATKAALAKVAPCVVQIQTVGGLEVLGAGGRGQMLKGRGPTTGVIVSPDGYVISSSFNFIHKPAAVTVMVPGGKEPLNARVIATDHTRMLTLLKVEASGLPTPILVVKKEVQIGQWALAVGRTWSEGPTSPPSVSVGIVSALDRMYGKAMQTDAKVSPVNYGGPLIDLQGRVLGILVPMAPRGGGETAGVDWYDSGIGFAVPLEDLQRMLDKLKRGKDLRAGLLGVRFKGADMYSAPPVIDTVAFGTAADKAGIKPGDQIVEMDGVKIVRQAQILHVLGPKYEGDKVSVKVKRGDQVLDLPDLTLTGPPGSHAHGFLGILPMRDDPELGVEIRYVYPKSPAEEAKLKPGDRIMKFGEQAFSGRDQFQRRLDDLSPGQEVKLEVKRKDGKTETVTVQLAEIPDAVPEELPEGSHKKALAPRKEVPAPMIPGQPPRPPAPPKKDEKKPAPAKEEKKEEKKDARKGFFTKPDPSTGREYWVYVPEDYDPNISYALLVWLHPRGDAMQENILRIWRDLCKQHRIILLGPKAENPTGWLTSEVDSIKGDIREMLANYTIDRQRIVLHGLGNGSSLALYMAFDARDLGRGVAAIGGVMQNQPKENLAHQRLSFFLVAGGKDPDFEAIKTNKPRLEEKRFPIISHELPDHGNGYLTDAELLRKLARWIDSLDRL
jgi:S1-C subfamily serine protease/predicted esterase